MTLAKLSILLGIVVAVPQLYALTSPKGFIKQARAFPRNTAVGHVLMILATCWFLYNLKQESIADFEPLKNMMMLAFGALGVATCIYVQDFLPVRGAAILMMMVAQLMVNTARWHESSRRLVIVCWAYLLVLAGMWFTISPWRMRDLILWGTADEKRLKITSAIRLAFALLLVGLGLTVFKG